MKQAYRSVNFAAKTLTVIQQANVLAEEYIRQGYSLTLRQLYYRFVAGDLIPNKTTEYKRLGSIINDARYAGLFDWSYLTDRTRNVRGGDGSMIDPSEGINEYAYAMALWEGQPERVEVWVEKDALVDIVGRAAGRLRVPYFSCRGYTSSSEVKAAADRIERYVDDGATKVTVLHLGDHDPSGIDMSRDIETRLVEFFVGDGYLDRFNFELDRIALNMGQIEQYNPPPNPAKETDSRFAGYIRRYGEESWELDALEPRVLDSLISGAIKVMLDSTQWEERLAEQAKGRGTLVAIRENYQAVVDYLDLKGLLPEAGEGGS